MKRNILMAWRNLWRNKRRTIITIASVFFGVLLSTVMSSMQEGSYSSMIDNIVKFYSGYIQIHHEKYWDNKTINNSFTPTDSLLEKVRETEDVTDYTLRLESFALASSESITKGAVILGVNPEQENKVTELKRWLTDGDYLEQGDKSVLVSKGLAEYLKLGVNDTLVMIGQGYHGQSAAGKFLIKGIMNFPNPDLNSQSVYMDLGACQNFFSADNLATALVIMVKDEYHLKSAMHELKNRISSPYQVMSWDEMQPEIQQMINADRSGGNIMKMILYVLIGFGIFGTVMMMIVERKREMGVMVAIGMRRYKLAVVLFFETIYIGLVGVLAGFIGSIPIITYWYQNPIKLTGKAAETMVNMGIEPLMYFSWLPRVFYEQIITVFTMTLIISVYPVYTATRLKVYKALRG
jgi:ABC-type lipoprotein release transport system permease subunit